jgi:cytochrome P450
MEYSFARHDHRVEAPDFDPSWFQDSNDSARMSPLWRYFNPILRLILSLPHRMLSRLGRALAGLARSKDGIARQIEATRAAPKNPQTAGSYSTVFQELLDSKLPAEEKTTPRLTDEAILIIAAGTGTVAWTLSVATFHLLSDPEAHGHVPLATLQALPYFTAVIHESLRLSYGTTHRFQRIFSTPLTYTPSTSTKSSREWVIPAHTPISMSTVHLHHNESIFPDSHTFNPSRWIEEPSLTRYQMAFSKGSRRCLGINLAYAELYTVLAALFVKFGSNDVQGKKDKGILELAGTTQEDVEIWGDTFVAMQKPGSIGVRIVVKSI